MFLFFQGIFKINVFVLNNGRINQERISLYVCLIFSNYLTAAAAYSENSGLRSFHLT